MEPERDVLILRVPDTVTLPERLALGEDEEELLRHSVGEPDGELVGLLLVLMLRVTDTVTDVEAVEEGLTLDV